MCVCVCLSALTDQRDVADLLDDIKAGLARGMLQNKPTEQQHQQQPGSGSQPPPPSSPPQQPPMALNGNHVSSV